MGLKMANKNDIRVATVTATGARYKVQQIDFRTDVVRCWGEVTAYGGGRPTGHGESLTFPRSAVTVETVTVEQWRAMLPALFEQNLVRLEAAGKTVHRTRKGADVVSRPSEVSRRLAADVVSEMDRLKQVLASAKKG